jgi:hypothetical protein
LNAEGAEEEGTVEVTEGGEKVEEVEGGGKRIVAEAAKYLEKGDEGGWEGIGPLGR